MQFSDRLSIQPLNEKRIFQECKRLLWFAFGESKSIHLLQLEGTGSAQLLSEQGATVRPPLSSGLKSPFRHVREGRTHYNWQTKPLLSHSLGNRGQSPKGEGANPRDDCMRRTWRNCYTSVSYTHLTLPTTGSLCRSRWSPYH